jgi:signal transduction histidine kinase
VDAARRGTPVQADEGAPGELGELAVALNDLTRTVRRQQRDLEQRYEDLEVVTHAMAHDLRTPLTGIRGTLESLALGRVEDPAVRARLLERGLAAAIRLEAHIDDLLRLIRTIGDPIELAPVALGEIVAAEAEQLGLDEVVEVGDLPLVAGDRVLLGRLMANLLSNAAKFHPDGARVLIAVTADEPAAGWVEVHVDDSGVGIPPEERDVVLGPFMRGTRSPGVAGSGLGLAIASRVVHRHHGSLRIDDSPLGGARVSVRLPVHRPGPRERDASP